MSAPWSVTEATLAYRLRVSGLSSTEAADQLPGRTGPAIRALFTALRRRGIPIAPGTATHQDSSKRVVHLPLVPLAVIQSDRESGMDCAAIAKRHGISRTTAWKYAREAGQ